MIELDPWRVPPLKSFVIFLLAVFFTFASFGFISDVMNMGVNPPLRFVLGTLCSALFAPAYAASGVILRKRFWMGMIPLFVLQFLCQSLIGHFLRVPAAPSQLNQLQTDLLQSRLIFDGFAIIIAVSLGYTGFVYVSMSESKRYARSQIEKTTLESEMTAAREVQRVMVPDHVPQIPGFATESIYRPASEVGGDFFQVIPLKSGRTLIVIGDVSGKGLRAAMVVSMIVGTLRTVSGFTEEPAEILAEVNRSLCGHIQEGFATCLAIRLDASGGFTMANAGHLPPYRNGFELELPGSLPLGLSETSVYEQSTLTLTVGDDLVMLTDGVAEAQNEQRVLLGFDQVESMLRDRSTAKSLADLAQRHGQNDDVTVLRIERLAPAQRFVAHSELEPALPNL
jgi:hypothetical protein